MLLAEFVVEIRLLLMPFRLPAQPTRALVHYYLNLQLENNKFNVESTPCFSTVYIRLTKFAQVETSRSDLTI